MYASASLVWWLPARSSCSTAEPAVNSGHDRKLRAAADVTAIRPFQATGWPGRETTTLAGVVGFTAPASRPADKEAAPIFVTNIPVGYRDWRFISVAREEGSLNDIRAILGNDKAIKAYRDGKLPFPDGTIIARLAWSYDSSEENNKVFGSPQSFVAGHPKNGVQFMVKDSRKYATTGGWGTLNSTTANPPTKQSSKPAIPATRPSNLATLSSPVTHPDIENHTRKGIRP